MGLEIFGLIESELSGLRKSSVQLIASRLRPLQEYGS
jgi:hypothetical protein